MQTSEALTKARALIEAPERWTQGYFARDEGGRMVGATEPYAVCFCALGALRRVIRDAVGVTFPEDDEACCVGDELLSRAAQELYGDDAIGTDDSAIVNVNDQLGHAAVLACYDRAIAMAIAEEAA